MTKRAKLRRVDIDQVSTTATDGLEITPPNRRQRAERGRRRGRSSKQSDQEPSPKLVNPNEEGNLSGEVNPNPQIQESVEPNENGQANRPPPTILGVTDNLEEFLIRSPTSSITKVVPAREFEEMWPQSVIEFFKSRLKDPPHGVAITRIHRDHEIEKIIHAEKHSEGQVLLLIKWKDFDNPELIPSSDVQKKFPQLVIDFYQARIVFVEDEAQRELISPNSSFEVQSSHCIVLPGPLVPVHRVNVGDKSRGGR